MKLLLCKSCSDVVALRPNTERSCFCGESSGKYIDNINAEIKGPAMALGFANWSFLNAIRDQLEKGDRPDGKGYEFVAFTIPESAPSVKRI